MSLHKLTAGSGYDYLTRQVAALDSTERGYTGLASYYSERGETPGVWVGAGCDEIRPVGLTFSYLMQKPVHFLPAHINVEDDVEPIKTFIADTNCVLMKRHGITVLGRTVSECYGRVNILAAEVKRNILAEQLAAIRGSEVDRISKEEMEEMYRHGDAVMYPEVKR